MVVGGKEKDKKTMRGGEGQGGKEAGGRGRAGPWDPPLTWDSWAPCAPLPHQATLAFRLFQAAMVSSMARCQLALYYAVSSAD